MMDLSDQQMGAVHAGESDGTWKPIPLPTGPQQIPQWCVGLHVDWHYGVWNAPTVTLKVLGRVTTWPDQRWVKEGKKAYITRHPDGRACVHYHDGAVSMLGAWRNVLTPEQIKKVGHEANWSFVEPRRGGYDYTRGTTGPAETPEQAAHRDHVEWLTKATWLSEAERAERKCEFKVVRATTAQEGYGGSPYTILMEDGQELVLRGPWHGGAPDGYFEVSTVNWLEENNEAMAAKRAGTYRRYLQRELDRPWHRRSGTYGLYITQELALRLAAHFAPYVGAARVQKPYGERLELYQPQWGALKQTIIEREQKLAVEEKPASRFWRVYWDARGSYCGNLRLPKFGFQDDVHDRITAADVPKTRYA